MGLATKTPRVCKKGHRYFKSSICPVCPICEEEKKVGLDFMALLSAPARRALERENIDSLEKLKQYAEEEILQLHGIGPSAIPKLKKVLSDNGFSFRKKI
jgi:hypothetical protein